MLQPTRRPTCKAKPCCPGSVRHGFTLVEILVVVLILSILAVIVVPQFTSAAGETRENALKMDLFRIRQQLEVYKQQHDDSYPTLDNFESQLTQGSNQFGQTAVPGTEGYPYGPYLRNIPPNPFTSKNTVGSGAVGDSDWYYDESAAGFTPTTRPRTVNIDH